MKRSGKKKLTKQTVQKNLAMLLTMLTGAVCGILIVKFVDFSAYYGSGSQILLRFALFMLMMYISIYAQLVIHEAGHLIFGLATGYGFSSFRIGSLMWLKTGEGIKLKKLSIAGTGGQCLMTPPDMKDGRIPFVLYNLGGSLMNLITSLLCLGLYPLLRENAVLSALPLMCMFMGLALAITNGIPMRMGNVDNDGYNALSMGKKPQALRAFWVQLKINELTAAGVRLRDMPEEWFALPDSADMANSMCSSIAVFAANRLMDAHRFDEAEALMASLTADSSSIPGIYSGLLLCDRIYCELTGRNRPEQLEKFCGKGQKKFMKSMKNYPSVLRTEYSYALLSEKDENKAEKLLKRFDKAAVRYPHPSELEGERELMEIAAKKREDQGSATGG